MKNKMDNDQRYWKTRWIVTNGTENKVDCDKETQDIWASSLRINDKIKLKQQELEFWA